MTPYAEKIRSCVCSLCITRSPNPPVPATPSLPVRDQNPEGNKEVTTTFNSGSNAGALHPRTYHPAENHYTLDEAYTAVGEALYAELDRELSSSPAYQNTAYNGSDTDPDAPASSAPSSAYYSDLSCATGPDRTYEAVGLALNTASPSNSSWEGGDIAMRRQPVPRLAAITETITVPSDYV
ncbi:hypothetical protein ANN_21854 [Periplaneta americana]|uniref:Uncharacterized protein n=1 Tax=Periplaneta americana TaxID=6978 RepID=A0ABQ8S6U0_PERAM|nr:hypothetical protein ANN_21854 [Periplaneta americana]